MLAAHVVMQSFDWINRTGRGTIAVVDFPLARPVTPHFKFSSSKLGHGDATAYRGTATIAAQQAFRALPRPPVVEDWLRRVDHYRKKSEAHASLSDAPSALVPGGHLGHGPVTAALGAALRATAVTPRRHSSDLPMAMPHYVMHRTRGMRPI